MDQLFGSLLVKRVTYTTATKAMGMTMQMEFFSHKVAMKANEEVHILRDMVKSLEEQLYSGPIYKYSEMI